MVEALLHIISYFNQLVLPILLIWSIPAGLILIWSRKTVEMASLKILYRRYHLSQLILLLLPISVLVLTLNYLGISIAALFESTNVVGSTRYIQLPEVWVSSTPIQQPQSTILDWIIFSLPSTVFLLMFLWGIYKFTTAIIKIYRNLGTISYLDGQHQHSIIKDKQLAYPHVIFATSNSAISPYTVGLKRPLIVIPEGMLQHHEILLMALEHELFHICSNDFRQHLINECIAAIFFINPLVKRLVHLIHDDREKLCDLHVLDKGLFNPSEYASLLFEIGKKQHQSLSLYMAGNPSNLKKRIQMLMQSMHFSSKEYQRVGVQLSSIGMLFVIIIGLSVQPNFGSQNKGISSTPLAISPNKDAITNSQQSAKVSEEDVFVVVEQSPILKGGYSTLQKAIKYPEKARLNNIEGRVFVQFIVDTEGRVQNPEVIRGLGYGCDEAALEAVKQLEFEPGLQRGRAVNVRFSLPIVFKLQ